LFVHERLDFTLDLLDVAGDGWRWLARILGGRRP
jgi:hypothetical protein